LDLYRRPWCLTTHGIHQKDVDHEGRHFRIHARIPSRSSRVVYLRHEIGVCGVDHQGQRCAFQKSKPRVK
jgi:hypothetical protein